MTALSTLVLGYIGFQKHFITIGQEYSPGDIFYRSLQLFALEAGAVTGYVSWELQIARLLAPITAAYIAMRALSLIFREQFNLLKMRFLKGHVVICGLGRKGMLLAQNYRKLYKRVVVIELDEGNDMLEQCRGIGCIVLTGSAADREILAKARCHKADYLFTVSGNDAVNAEIAVHAREMAKVRKGGILTCIVHIVDPHLCNLLKEQEFTAESYNAFRLEFFNIFDSGSRIWLKLFPPFRDGDGSGKSHPHLFIIGVGKMGENLLIQVAKKWKALNPGIRKRFPITLIDKKANFKKELFRIVYPRLEQICDLTFLQMDIESPEFQRGDFLFSNNKKCIASDIFVCLDNDSFALSTAMALNLHVRKERIPIIVRMTRDTGVSSLLKSNRKEEDTHATIKSFALLDHTCRPDIIFGGNHETIARAIHEEYRSHRMEMGETPTTNPSLVNWEELPEHLKESNRRQADHIGEKLRSIGCGISHLNDWDEKLITFEQKEIRKMARMEHERWFSERKLEGWRLGQKDIGKKTTPSLIPWEALPDKDKRHNLNMVKKLPVFMAKAGLKIFRLKVNKSSRIPKEDYK